MKEPSYYAGREQTYAKHLFIERYLERVGMVKGYAESEFAYVDGFSGPWRSQDEAFMDTSFMIAIEKIRQVRRWLAARDKHPRFRCLFVEKNRRAFRDLSAAVDQIEDIDIDVLNIAFEDAIDDVVQWIGSAFSLAFIDPTGWTGFGMTEISPLLAHRPGEVIVNLMYDHLNRFLQVASDDSKNALFGGAGWEAPAMAGTERERAIIGLYRDHLRAAGRFTHTTSTRILKPTSDRVYFHLIYGTRHLQGLREFRETERKTVELQENVRLDAKQARRIERSGQGELFREGDVTRGHAFEEERAIQRAAAGDRLRLLVRSKRKVGFEEVMGTLLEMPLVWERDIQAMVREMRQAGDLGIEGLRPRERTFKPGHHLARS